MQDLIYFIFEIIGTIAFSVSGAMIGIKKEMDIFGITMLGVITAVGGGIIRDIIIGMTPPTAFREPVYGIIAILAALITFIPIFRNRIDLKQRLWIWVDTIGLAVFTVLGVRTGARFDNIFLQVFLGTITGVGGGTIRDICAGELPMIFVKHFYACACIIGALVCSLLYHINTTAAMAAGILIIVVLRLLAAHFRWKLPKP